jgi:hypothetical protein
MNWTFAHSQAVGGKGVDGGNGTAGLGGGISAVLGSTLTVSKCTVDYHQAVGGAGEDGGDGLGGGIYDDGNSAFGVSSLSVIGSTITHNKAKGGEGQGGNADRWRFGLVSETEMEHLPILTDPTRTCGS